LESLKEKQSAAVSSLLVAVALTTLKAIVGILTNSLGIMSEALHSGLDLVAALTTVYAVRASSKPPDEEHPYGHGKYESLSALVETLLLLATCTWITYEAVQRLFFREAHVEATLAAYAVMTVSIVLDISRSRVLYRTARKYHSQALEADALHFSTDILSSSVVILGLIFLTFGYRIADPLAALGVVVVVVVLSLRLGRRTVFVLLDRAPEGLAETIRAQVVRIPGIRSCSRVRVRPSGAQTFVDLEVLVGRSASFETVNEIAVAVENAIRKLVPDSDIVVRTQPSAEPETGLAAKIRKLASQIPEIRGLHNIEIHDAEDGVHVELHIEADPDTDLKTAHDIATRLESAIKTNIGEVAEVATHIESSDEMPHIRADVTSESHAIVKAVRKNAMQIAGVKGCRNVAVHRAEDGLHLTATCLVDPNLAVSEAHELSTRAEEILRMKIDGVARVLVHLEPGPARRK
jgi:cation diffusion facilitator family transporter